MKRRTMYCAIVTPYRVQVGIPAAERWETGHERPDFVFQNMAGATVDFIIRTDRESGFAVGSRRPAARSPCYFFARGPALCREGARLKCRLLSAGPRRCLWSRRKPRSVMPKFARLAGLSVQVEHYRFLGGSSRDRPAEQAHIALIEACNEMNSDALFTRRDDVECPDNYEFQIEEQKGNCHAYQSSPFVGKMTAVMAGANALRSRITGTRQFERLLSRQTDEEQLFGRIDLSSPVPGSVPERVLKDDAIYKTLRYDLERAADNSAQDRPETLDAIRQSLEKPEAYCTVMAALHAGEPTVQTAGKIPAADIVFLDEYFKANEGVLNALPTALNQRKYTNEGRTYPIPTISFFAASSEISGFAGPQEKIPEALYDRLELKVVTENISDRTGPAGQGGRTRRSDCRLALSPGLGIQRNLRGD